MIITAPLYRLTPRDSAVDQLQLVAQTRFKNEGSSNVIHWYDVPQDRIFLWRAFWYQWIAGGAYNLTQLVIRVDSASGNSYYRESILHSTQSGSNIVRYPQDQVIPPSFRIELDFQFASGAATNQTTVSFMGYAIPRGAFSYGGLTIVL